MLNDKFGIHFIKDRFLNLGFHLDHKTPYLAIHMPGFRVEMGWGSKPVHVWASCKRIWILGLDRPSCQATRDYAREIIGRLDKTDGGEL